MQSGVWRYSFDRRSQSHQSHFVKVTSKLRLRSASGSSYSGSYQQPQRSPLTAKLRIVPPALGDAPYILLATVRPLVDIHVIYFPATPHSLRTINNCIPDLVS